MPASVLAFFKITDDTDQIYSVDLITLLNQDEDLPFLPPEIEREIFEMTADLHPRTIPVLLLVCHRVHEWIEIVKYNTVTSSGTTSFFRDRVRHFFYMPKFEVESADRFSDNELSEILAACSGIQSLVMMTPVGPTVLSSSESIHPRRLAVYLNALLPADSRLDLTHPMFAFVTHLDLFDKSRDLRGRSLSLLPSLTHLGLFQLNDPLDATGLLQTCKNLQVLIGMRAYYLPETKFGGPGPVTDDPRLLSMVVDDVDYEDDWLIGTRGGLDFWARADAFVAKRRRGEIKPGMSS
ncbi:hypothetical protein C8R43DRAFT_1116550 [Mycena crocata]|nr:hypothetical protein C8R43DRAFT_1116550 [Mycena crocata]